MTVIGAESPDSKSLTRYEVGLGLNQSSKSHDWSNLTGSGAIVESVKSGGMMRVGEVRLDEVGIKVVKQRERKNFASTSTGARLRTLLQRIRQPTRFSVTSCKEYPR